MQANSLTTLEDFEVEVIQKACRVAEIANSDESDLDKDILDIWQFEPAIPARHQDLAFDALFRNTRSDRWRFYSELNNGIKSLKDELTENYSIKSRPFHVFLNTLSEMTCEVLENPDIILSGELKHTISNYLYNQDQKYFTSINNRSFRYESPDLGGPICFGKANPGEHFIISNGMLGKELIYFDFLDSKQEMCWIAKQYMNSLFRVEKEVGNPIDLIILLLKQRGPLGTKKIIEPLKELATPLKKGVVLVDIEAEEEYQKLYNKDLLEYRDHNAMVFYDLCISGSKLQKTYEVLSSIFDIPIAANTVMHKYSDVPKDKKKMSPKVDSMTTPLHSQDEIKRAFNEGVKDESEKCKSLSISVPFTSTSNVEFSEKEVENLLDNKYYSSLENLVREDSIPTLRYLISLIPERLSNIDDNEVRQVWKTVYNALETDQELKNSLTKVLAKKYKSAFRQHLEYAGELIWASIGSITHSSSLLTTREFFHSAKKYFERKYEKDFSNRVIRADEFD